MKTSHGFTLTELLVVMAIIVMVTSLSGPMIASLSNANSTSKAIGDVSCTLEQARAYAMANNTYVRVGFSTLPQSSSHPAPSIIVLCFYSVDGTLNASTQADMGSNAKWPAVGNPVILENLNFNNALGTASDATPDTTDITAFTRTVSDLGPVSFSSCIQFGPSGVAQVQQSSPVRFIKVALDRPAPMDGKNPFVIRMGGLTGSIEILRKENL